MAVYTKLTAHELEGLINQYDIGVLKSFHEIEEGVENSNYLIHVAKDIPKVYILTIYEKRVAACDLPFFLNLTEHLKNNGIPCPAPVHDRAGGILQEIKGKKCALVTFLAGKSVAEIKAEDCREVGGMLAKMHIAGADFSGWRQNSMGKKSWRELFEKTRNRMGEISAMDAGIVESALQMLEEKWPENLPAGVIHADLFPDNVFFEDRNLSGVIDFYFACNDFLSYDLAICINSWCFDAAGKIIKEKARAMFEGYDAIRKIGEEELEYLPLLCTGSALRFLLTRTYDWLNPVHGATVKKRDPLEYWRKLQFHLGVESMADYGIPQPSP